MCNLFSAKTASELARLLGLFELHLRPCLRRTTWFDCIGQGHLTRIYGRDDLRGSEAKKQKERARKIVDAKEYEDRLVYQSTLHNPEHFYVRNKEPVLLNRLSKLAQLKGEEYRHVRNQKGWQWKSTCWRRTYVRKAPKEEPESEHNHPETETQNGRTTDSSTEVKPGKVLKTFLAAREMMEKARIEKEETEKSNEEKTKKETENQELDDILESVLSAAKSCEEANEKDKKGDDGKVNGEPKVIAATAKAVKLERVSVKAEKRDEKVRIKKFVSRGTSNIFRFSFGARRLARTGGVVAAARGFNYLSKSHKSREVWPYPAPKPFFHVWWKYRLSQCQDVFSLAHLFSTLVRLLKWDLVNERPPFVEGHKLDWTEKSDEEHSHFEIKRQRFIPGSGRLRQEYEMKMETIPIESDEVIPTRDSRAVEAMARSGRVLRRLKPTVDDIHPRSEHRETLTWIPEEKMKIWQIDLYHRVTEDGGVNIKRSDTSQPTGHSLRPRGSLRPPPKIAPDDDYKEQ